MMYAPRITGIESQIFDTKPVAIHFPSIHRLRHPRINCETWSRIQSYISMRPKLKTPADLTIFTWNNRPHPSTLESYANRIGLEVVRLSTPKRWTNVAKIRLTLEFLESVKTKYVMGLDGDDAIIVDDPQRAVNTLEESGDGIIFGADPVLWPINPGMLHRYMTVCTHHSYLRYLNSGQFIGTKKAVRNCYKLAEKYKPYRHGSDQSILHQVYVDHYPLISIDSFAEIFYVIPGATIATSMMRFV